MRKPISVHAATRFALWILSGIFSFALTAYGIYSFLASDLRRDTLIVFLYCILPALSFPVLLLPTRFARIASAMHWLIACAYPAVYSALDWRTCAELGYCSSVLHTVFETLTLWPVEAAIAVAVLETASVALTHRDVLKIDR